MIEGGSPLANKIAVTLATTLVCLLCTAPVNAGAAELTTDQGYDSVNQIGIYSNATLQAYGENYGYIIPYSTDAGGRTSKLYALDPAAIYVPQNTVLSNKSDRWDPGLQFIITSTDLQLENADENSRIHVYRSYSKSDYSPDPNIKMRRGSVARQLAIWAYLKNIEGNALHRQVNLDDNMNPDSSDEEKEIIDAASALASDARKRKKEWKTYSSYLHAVSKPSVSAMSPTTHLSVTADGAYYVTPYVTVTAPSDGTATINAVALSIKSPDKRIKAEFIDQNGVVQTEFHPGVPYAARIPAKEIAGDIQTTVSIVANVNEEVGRVVTYRAQDASLAPLAHIDDDQQAFEVSRTFSLVRKDDFSLWSDRLSNIAVTITIVFWTLCLFRSLLKR